VTKDVVLKLTDSDDTVAIDLGGLSTPRGIRANLGDGVNSLTIDNGTISRSLEVKGGADADTVTLGGTVALTINRDARIDLRGSADDVLELGANATVNGSLEAIFADTVNLDAGSTVGKNVLLVGGSGGSKVSVDGTVSGSVLFAASAHGEDHDHHG